MSISEKPELNVKKYLLICVVTSAAIFRCSSEAPVAPEVGGQFALHVLRDSTLKIGDVVAMDIDDLAVDPQPLLSSGDIFFYDYSSHSIYLRANRTPLLPKRERDGLFPESWWGRPFVVLAGGKKQYRGAFYSVVQTPQYQVPFIEDLGQYPEDVLHIAWIWPYLVDGRDDVNVRDALSGEGLLRAGLSIELDEVSILENADTSTVSYTFKIWNHDIDNLYTVDPEQMGAELFHFFVNGPILWNKGENIDYRSVYKEVRSPEPFDNWEPSWFTRINRGESMRRKVILKGYPPLPPGRYSSRLRYNGPVNILEGQRYLDDGRYWLGPIDSDEINLTIR